MLALSQDPLQLRSAKLGTVQLLLGHQFRLVAESRKDWHVSTIAYRYHLLDGDIPTCTSAGHRSTAAPIYPRAG